MDEEKKSYLTDEEFNAIMDRMSDRKELSPEDMDDLDRLRDSMYAMMAIVKDEEDYKKRYDELEKEHEDLKRRYRERWESGRSDRSKDPDSGAKEEKEIKKIDDLFVEKED